MPLGTMADVREIESGGFLIRIDRSFSEDLALECLCHETSHIFSGKINYYHNAVWGRAYASVYCCYLEWLDSLGQN